MFPQWCTRNRLTGTRYRFQFQQDLSPESKSRQTQSSKGESEKFSFISISNRLISFSRKLVWPAFASLKRHPARPSSAKRKRLKHVWPPKNLESNSTTTTEKRTYSNCSTTICCAAWRRRPTASSWSWKSPTTAIPRDPVRPLRWRAPRTRRSP